MRILHIANPGSLENLARMASYGAKGKHDLVVVSGLSGVRFSDEGLAKRAEYGKIMNEAAQVIMAQSGFNDFDKFVENVKELLKYPDTEQGQLATKFAEAHDNYFGMNDSFFQASDKSYKEMTGVLQAMPQYPSNLAVIPSFLDTWRLFNFAGRPVNIHRFSREVHYDDGARERNSVKLLGYGSTSSSALPGNGMIPFSDRSERDAARLMLKTDPDIVVLPFHPYLDGKNLPDNARSIKRAIRIVKPALVLCANPGYLRVTKVTSKDGYPTIIVNSGSGGQFGEVIMQDDSQDGLQSAYPTRVNFYQLGEKNIRQIGRYDIPVPDCAKDSPVEKPREAQADDEDTILVSEAK
jgi:hypothetical protein